jgi:hypothetical protein
MVFAIMGTNHGDFDNDGWLDMYLGTGEPNLATLVPNRMFKNVDGLRFGEITASSGTGHLQKGHGVACGDWDRDGDSAAGLTYLTDPADAQRRSWVRPTHLDCPMKCQAFVSTATSTPRRSLSARRPR